MQERFTLYRCTTCKNVVEMVQAKGGHLSCCGQPMLEVVPHEVEAALEKHIPVITQVDGGIFVSVGEVAHPMEEEHLILWIELTVDGITRKQYLNPGDKPEAFFPNITGKNIIAREFCNLHGSWVSK